MAPVQSKKPPRSFANHINSAASEKYWVPGPRKDGQDTLYPALIEIDDDVREERGRSIRSLPEGAALTSFRSLGVHDKHATR